MMDVKIPMKALLRFKPINAKPPKWWKRYVFLCTNDAGLTAMRTCGASMWACTVPWRGEPPKKTRYGVLDVQQWKACLMGDPVATHDDADTVTIGAETFGWQKADDKYDYVPPADVTYRILRSVGLPLAPYFDATEVIDRIHNARPDASGSIEIEDLGQYYLYNWDAIMRWLGACMFGSAKQIAFAKYGTIHMRNDEGFELVMAPRNPAKGD